MTLPLPDALLVIAIVLVLGIAQVIEHCEDCRARIDAILRAIDDETRN